MRLKLHRGIILVCIIYAGLTGCYPERQETQDHSVLGNYDTRYAADSTTLIPIETFSSDYFPCNDCHSEILPNPQRRVLVDMHDEIVFDHDSENRWCLACHSETSRDSLVLAGGEMLGFDKSYILCGQCHGPKIRDWKLGIHGKRTGEWNGQKQYLLCAHCHDPHSPRIKHLSPMPAPRRPNEIKIDSIYERERQNPASP
jgi:hypothetical protein